MTSHSLSGFQPYCVAISLSMLKFRSNLAYARVSSLQSVTAVAKLELHITTLCEAASNRSFVFARSGAPLTLAACQQVNASLPLSGDTLRGTNVTSRARCSHFARLAHVLKAAYDDAQGSECCNVLAVSS